MKQSRRTPNLNPDISLRSNLRTIFQVAIGHTFFEMKRITKNFPPGAIHDCRVSARRLRALLKVFHAAFPRKPLKKILRMLTLLLHSLGRVRDCDVIIDNLNSVRHVVSREGQSSIDLLIVKQMASRKKHSAALGRLVLRLEASRYRSSLRSFVRSSLA